MDSLMPSIYYPNSSIGGNVTLTHEIRRRHLSFVNYGDLETCFHQSLATKGSEEVCQFVTDTPSCKDLTILIDYLNFMVCTLKFKADTAGRIYICLCAISIVSIYAAFLFIVSKYFILPNIIHVAHYIHIPLYDYGVTTISVILTAPDLLWVLHTCDKYSQNGTLLLALMMGKMITSFSMGMGVICLKQKRGQTKYPGIEFITQLTLSGIATAYSTDIIYRKLVKDFDPMGKATSVNVRIHAFISIIAYVSYIAYLILTKRRFGRRSTAQLSSGFEVKAYESRSGWSQLLHALNPFEHMRTHRALIGIAVPLWIISAIHIPVIDKNRTMFGWCKYLTCLNFLIFPWQVFVLAGTYRLSFLIYLTVIVVIIAIVITMAFTKVHQAPKFQGFYAIAGIIMGFSTYRIVGSELETMLWQISNFVFNMPRDIIMLTSFVFNYLLNCVIFSFELADMGYSNLAIGVIVGIALNLSFMILPIIVFQYCYRFEGLVAVSANTLTCFIFLIIIFCATIFQALITNYYLRASQAIFFISFYIFYMIFLILSGTNVIHPFGGFHTIAVEMKREVSTWA